MSPAWIGRLLRARELQEERAKVEVAAARRSSARAAALARAHGSRLDALTQQEAAGVVGAFVASVVALQAAAATHASTLRLAEQADSITRARQEDLRAAARERRSSEELAAREAENERRRAEQLQQRDLDEAATGVHLRRTGQEPS